MDPQHSTQQNAVCLTRMEPHRGAEAPGKWVAGFKQRPEWDCFLLFHGAGRGKHKKGANSTQCVSLPAWPPNLSSHSLLQSLRAPHPVTGRQGGRRAQGRAARSLRSGPDHRTQQTQRVCMSLTWTANISFAHVTTNI